jgi:hypothetical protein
MDGLRMIREEEGTIEEEIGVLRSGKIFWYSKKRNLDDIEGNHSEVEER